MKRTLILLLAVCLCACQPAEHRGAHGPVKPKEPVQPQGDGIATYMLCDFDTLAPEVKPVNSTFEEAANPAKDEVNGSERVGKTVLSGGTWDCVQVSPTHPLDFTKDPAIFRVKVFAPAKTRLKELRIWENPFVNICRIICFTIWFRRDYYNST